MNALSKTVISLLATAGLLAPASAVLAQTVSPTGPVTATGQMTLSFAGFLTTVCNITFVGVADPTGFTFTSYTGAAVTGPISCNDSGPSLPLRVDAVSFSQVVMPNFVYQMIGIDCPGVNVPATFGFSAITIPTTTTLPGGCRVSGRLTVSPVTIIN